MMCVSMKSSSHSPLNICILSCSKTTILPSPLFTFTTASLLLSFTIAIAQHLYYIVSLSAHSFASFAFTTAIHHHHHSMPLSYRLPHCPCLHLPCPFHLPWLCCPFLLALANFPPHPFSLLMESLLCFKFTQIHLCTPYQLHICKLAFFPFSPCLHPLLLFVPPVVAHLPHTSIFIVHSTYSWNTVYMAHMYITSWLGTQMHNFFSLFYRSCNLIKLCWYPPKKRWHQKEQNSRWEEKTSTQETKETCADVDLCLAQLQQHMLSHLWDVDLSCYGCSMKWGRMHIIDSTSYYIITFFMQDFWVLHSDN